MKYFNNEHKKAYHLAIEKSGINDVYHQSLFYTLTIDKDCREHINDLFNGYVDEKNAKVSTPYELFSCEYSSFFMESIKLRYPEYYKSRKDKSFDNCL